ncbi:hypothetical protein Bca4012_000301 [Brassica carinata]
MTATYQLDEPLFRQHLPHDEASLMRHRRSVPLFISWEKVQQTRRCNLVELTLADERPLLSLILFRKLLAGTSIAVSVTGYDKLLSKIDIERALRKHFSSCGEISYVKISTKFASAEFAIVGEHAQEKVFEVDGSHINLLRLFVGE